MKAYGLMRKYAAAQVVDNMLLLLTSDPQRRLVTLTRILETFAGAHERKEQIRKAREAFIVAKLENVEVG